MKRHDLSKTKITLFEQCPKRLWLSVRRRDLIKIDAATQARFDTGHAVGNLACDLVEDGVMVTMDEGVQGALQQTSNLIAAADLPIFEGTFQHEGVLVRVDIMWPDRKDGWHVAEVKSTASRKDYHIADLATQVWVMEGAGIKIASAFIRHINTKFVYARERDYLGFLTDRRSDEELRPIADDRLAVVLDARQTLHGDEPDIAPGPHCDEPFGCDFKEYCYRGIKQAEWPNSLLPRTGKKIAAAYQVKGVEELTEIPAGELKNPAHETIRIATVSAEPFHDPELAGKLTADWVSPRIYLDFETINPAIPRWIGTRPFQQIPFQFSAHIEDTSGAIEHREYLSLEDADPRRAFAEALLDAVPPKGAIITYNARFERSRLNELAARFGDLSEALKGLASRVVDLEPVARQCWYHRDQKGSWSIKYVLPTIPGISGYDDLDIQDGMEAQRAYFEALKEPIGSSRRDEIAQSLRDYCAKDTFAMVELLRHLTNESAGGVAEN
ncbi:DUF2779 domain-containing protein [Pontixanthobacter aquaemixtae]|uniref:DUF2779 domain-containing protein n=1 Tax=Pontixanthobacter aquaemixtae TaxID=1958940 RepID=A0A844ZW65_9SPHN|nr:DUF2779 domain-containing protein [Pontixanthobacter aquaemixtae]MXO91502.1 DUF2779 domain-containing protein [Pontixanthobacter aquaemixtae]